MKLLSVSLLTIFLLLQFCLWFSDYSLPSLLHLHQLVEVQKKQNLKAQQRNKLLLAEVRDLKTGDNALEERARNDLGMVKRGETFLQIIENNGKR